MRSLRAAFVLSVFLATSPAALAQTRPVPQNSVLYGPGRVDASQILYYDGQDISACGRVGHVDVANHVIVIADNLRVYLRPDADTQSLWGTVACATGVVSVQHDGGMNFAIISAPERVDVISGTGPYQPPRPQCGPGQMIDQATGGCVQRYRASPY